MMFCQIVAGVYGSVREVRSNAHSYRNSNNVLTRPPHPDTPRIPPALLIAVNGFLVLVALSALVSIWFGRTGGD